MLVFVGCDCVKEKGGGYSLLTGQSVESVCTEFDPAGDWLLKKILVVVAPLALGACGGPVELTVAKLAGDLISYVTTGKSTTDHAVSIAADQDCALHRPLFEEDVCRENEEIIEDAVALAEPGAPSVKQTIREAQPAIYAVNAPAEKWSKPPNDARTSSVIVRTDLPPMAKPVSEPVSDQISPSITNPAGNSMPTPGIDEKPLEVASAQEQFAPEYDKISRRDLGPADPQAEADAAIVGYVDHVEPTVLVTQTRTAALTDDAIRSDSGEISVVAPVDLAQDSLVAVPLPGDYVVLASFADQVRAQKALNIYSEYQPRLIRATVKGTAYLRVAVGPLSQEHARDLRHLAAKKGVKDPWIVGIDTAGE